VTLRPLVDSHCHLDYLARDGGDLPGVLARARGAGIGTMLTIGTKLREFDVVLGIAEANADVVCSVGIHPHEAGNEATDVARLVALAAHPKVVGIGETGLDYYRLTGDLAWQRERFRTHIRAARECGKPLVIHTRSAAEDTIRIMKEEGAGDAGGVMHCFTETWEVARAALDLGFHISFSGIVTFKNAVPLKEVAKQVPLERMLVETDSPYLAPVPHRGKSNQPAFVRHVAEEVARLRGIAYEDVARATTENFFRLFRHARPA
jgi:TatD DNase family protein